VSGGRALRFTRTAEKELRRLDPPIRVRVLGALDRLSADDRSLDVRRLTGSEHFRLRVGDWRVIFDYDRATQTVLVRHVLPLRGITISRLDEDGRTVEDRGHSDSIALLGQIGVIRTLILGLEILTRHVKLPKGALKAR
jgi:mRNA interferase RelE/StbE